MTSLATTKQITSAIAVQVKNLTTAELEQYTREASWNASQAWTAQSETTVEDGYTSQQATEAIWQAETAQQIYDCFHAQLQERYEQEKNLASLIANQSVDEYETVDGIMGGDYEAELPY